MRSLKWLVGVLCTICFVAAEAELTVDTKFPVSTKNISLSAPNSQSDERYVWFNEGWELRVLDYIASVNKGNAPEYLYFLDPRYPRPYVEGDEAEQSELPHRAHLIWDKSEYYAWAESFLSFRQIDEANKALSSRKESILLPGGGICTVFLHDKNLSPVTATKIDLPENNYGTWCNGTYALGSAGKGIDGLLLTISYDLIGKNLVQRSEDVGQGWHRMTVLLRLQKDASGKIRLVQDDRCLGNPNKHKDIPSARKALSRCEGR